MTRWMGRGTCSDAIFCESRLPNTFDEHLSLHFIFLLQEIREIFKGKGYVFNYFLSGQNNCIDHRISVCIGEAQQLVPLQIKIFTKYFYSCTVFN